MADPPTQRAEAGRFSTPRAIASVFIVTAVTVTSLLFLQSAQAFDPIAATSTSTTAAVKSQANPLAAVAVSGGDGVTTLRISVSTDLGTLSMASNPTGLTLATGFSSWSNQAEIAFTGTRDNVNAALATLTLNPGNTAGSTAHMTINVQEFTAGMAYSPENGHYYQFIAAPQIMFDAARTAAQSLTYGGQSGYLASIPSGTINDLIADKIPGATNVWFGAAATNYPSGTVRRSWAWTDGPLAGTVMLKCSNPSDVCSEVEGPWPLSGLWAGGEPNNWSNIESAAVTNWSGMPGEWNDLSPTENGNIDGYIAEFGDQANGSSTPFTGTDTDTASVAVVAGPPGAPTGVTATSHGATGTVSWTAPADDGGSPVTHYTVTATGGGTCTATAPAVTCSISGLTIGNTYTFTVVTHTAAGTSTSSTPSNAVTPTTATPAPPSNVVASPIDSTSVIVSWTATDDDGGEPVTYTVTAEPGGLSCQTTETSCVVSGLSPGTNYAFSVSAVNSAGSSGAAASLLTTTPAAAADEVAPVLSGVGFNSRRIRPAKRKAGPILAASSIDDLLGSAKRKRAKVGTTVYLTSSEDAMLSVRIHRVHTGVVSRGRCVSRKRRRPGRSAKTCVLKRSVIPVVGTVTVKAGANRLKFTGRVRGKKLRTGRYDLIFRLTDAAGNVSNEKSAKIRVVKR